MPNKTHFRPSSWIVRYGGALIAVALATVIRLLLNPMLGSSLPFTTYFVAAVLVAVLSGLGPALMTVAFGAVLGPYLFIPPEQRLRIDGTADIFQIVAFCVLAAGLSIVIK